MKIHESGGFVHFFYRRRRSSGMMPTTINLAILGGSLTGGSIGIMLRFNGQIAGIGGSILKFVPDPPNRWYMPLTDVLTPLSKKCRLGIGLKKLILGRRWAWLNSRW